MKQVELTDNDILTILHKAESVPLGMPIWESSEEFTKLVKIIHTAINYKAHLISEHKESLYQHLKQIQDRTNDLLIEARQDRSIKGVNWGDLSCVDVMECKSVYGYEPTILVEIEECSPDSNLRSFIYDRLIKLFPDVCFDVRTEW